MSQIHIFPLHFWNNESRRNDHCACSNGENGGNQPHDERSHDCHS